MKHALALLLTIAACAAPTPGDDPARLGPLDPTDIPANTARPARAFGGFSGYYDHGRMYLEVNVPGQAAQFATDMPLGTQSSGSAGTTTPAAGSVLLHQTTAVSSATRDAACNSAPFGDTGVPASFQGVCVPVQAISGYAEYILNPYVQLVSLAPCGTTTTVVTYVKDASSSTIGVDNTLGLWGYTQPGGFALLYPAGDTMGRDRATRNWFFATDQPGASACFRFTAVVMGQPWTP